MVLLEVGHELVEVGADVPVHVHQRVEGDDRGHVEVSRATVVRIGLQIGRKEKKKEKEREAEVRRVHQESQSKASKGKGITHDERCVELAHGLLVGGDEVVEALHVALLLAGQGVVGQVLHHLGHQDELSLSRRVRRIYEVVATALVLMPDGPKVESAHL